MLQPDSDPLREFADVCRYAGEQDCALARELFAAGVAPRTVAHTLQLPALLVEQLTRGQPVPAKPLIAPCKIFHSDEGPARYATTARAANRAAHAGPVPRWWSSEFGYHRDEPSRLDSLWALDDLPSAASHFIVSDGLSRCPQCKTMLKRFLGSSPGAGADIVSQPVGTRADGLVRRAPDCDYGLKPVEVVWGVDQVVCAACWASYEPGVEALLASRRKRLRAKLDGARCKSTAATKPAPRSALDLLCERHGVSSVDLWMALRLKTDPIDGATYCRVESLEGDVVRLRAPAGRRSRSVTTKAVNLERALELKRAVNSPEQPIRQTALQAFCIRMGVAPSSLAIDVDGKRAGAVAIRDGLIYFHHNTLPPDTYRTRTVEFMEALIGAGAVSTVPLIACTRRGPGASLRYPCATDDDVQRVGQMIAREMPAADLDDHSRLTTKGEDLSPVEVWLRLARIGDEIGNPAWARAVRSNVQAIGFPSSRAVQCAAGWLLHLLTTKRTSLIGKPVLQRLYASERLEHLFEPMIDDWCSADDVLKPYAAAARRLGLDKALS